MIKSIDSCCTEYVVRVLDCCVSKCLSLILLVDALNNSALADITVQYKYMNTSDL